MSKTAYDQYIDADEEEETCPLCIEDFDLTDKGFKPCPCGYQICQFCYNNVKNNMNGLCPACRRQYDDKQIEYKVITPEETAAYKARQAQKQKKTQAALQKEKQKAEADSLSRKHLAGLRVVQKNLVYVTGIAPKMQEDELLQTLRGDKYFGQYGKIIKIVVSKARDKHDSVGVYVTYEHKEDAASCIAAVDGNVNGDRTLRAQFGTTKYCSAYLRGDQCSNRNCMFLHEPGEAKDSYSRADLSALNAGSTQHGEPRPPPPQSQQPVSAATQPMARQPSDQHGSPTERPALPSTASWASKPIQQAESRAASSVAPSPAVVPASLAQAQTDSAVQAAQAKKPAQAPKAAPSRPRTPSPLRNMLRKFKSDSLCFDFNADMLTAEELQIIENFPPLFDLSTGPAQRRLRRQKEQDALRFFKDKQARPEAADDLAKTAGALHVGEEEDWNSHGRPFAGVDGLDQEIQPFGDTWATSAHTNEHLAQQHQQTLLDAMKSVTPQSASQGHALGHQRNASRFSFANDTASASATVKPVANAKAMNQQTAMMPSQSSYSNQAQFFTSNVQGPPPGLKATGTPPVSGGMTFAQGHGFTTGGLPYASGNGGNRNQNDEMMRDLMRGRTNEAAAKRDEDFPPLGPVRQASITSIPPGLHNDSTRRSTPILPPGLEDAIQSRRETPSLVGLGSSTDGLPAAPGLGDLQHAVNENTNKPNKPMALPDLTVGSSRPSSRSGLSRVNSSQVVPVVPLRIATPAKVESRPATPSRLMSRTASPAHKPQLVGYETPTKKGKERAKDTQEMQDLMAEVVKRQMADDDAKPRATDQTSTPEKMPVDIAQSRTSLPTQAVDQEASKRRHPGKLDISTALSENIEPAFTNTTGSPVDTVAKRAVSQAPSIRSIPGSPSTASVASPLNKPAPRTLRVVQTPKAETPPPAPVVVTALAAGARKQPSRQPSVASMNLPGTPSSEHVSIPDNISVTSTSQSRANTPPPVVSKVGSAPVRSQTKSQVKKQRQERAKALEEEQAKIEPGSTVTTVAEPKQEAIISRKKKAKKEREVKPRTKPPREVESVTKHSSPIISRPVSPVPLPTPMPATTTPVEKVEIVPEAVAPPAPEPSSPAAATTTSLTPAQIIAELKAVDPTFSRSLEALFKVPMAQSGKSTATITQVDLQDPASWRSTDFNIKLSKEDVSNLLSGRSTAIGWDGADGRIWSRTMITPGGAQIRGLDEELERRFVALEKQIHDLPEELRFRPTKPQNETRFPSFDLKALKRSFDSKGPRGVSVMEQMVQDGSPMKKGAFLVDEASRYINEFVMPPVILPPSTNQSTTSNSGQQQAHMVPGINVSANQQEATMPSLEAAERAFLDAKHAVDDRESALRRVIRKNKKLLGLV